jgi:hypothetical protein
VTPPKKVRFISSGRKRLSYKLYQFVYLMALTIVAWGLRGPVASQILQADEPLDGGNNFNEVGLDNSAWAAQ